MAGAPCKLLAFCITIVMSSVSLIAIADRMDSYQIGTSGQANVKHPGWFKDSFLNLQDDLFEARESGKRGIIVYLGQENCSHCQAFMDTTLADSETRNRVQKRYDVIGLDIFSDLELMDIDGTSLTVKNFAEAKGARFTPTILFYGTEQSQLLKIVGFYPPEKFNRVLDYIDSEHYRTQKLSEYLRAGKDDASGPGSITVDYSLFARPPHDLDRRGGSGERPTMILFENPDCSPCRRFHQRVLANVQVRELLSEFDVIQLDVSDEGTRITTPAGEYVTPKRWSKELRLTYDIAIVFLDNDGNEVHRIDSETGKDRFFGSMQYVLEGAYKRYGVYQRWRREKALQATQGS